jgi:hypothetical protein
MKSTNAIIFILIAIGLFYTVINPHYSKVQALQTEADKYADVLDNVDSLTQKRDDLLTKYNSISKDQIARIEKAVPDNIDSVRLAVDFDSIASKYGISIKNIKTTTKTEDNSSVIQPVSKNGYGSVRVDFSFISTYDNYRKFMKDIESSLRIIDIRTTSFRGSENGLYEYNVSIDTYWLK